MRTLLTVTLGLTVLAWARPALAAVDTPRGVAAAVANDLATFYVYPARARRTAALLRRKAANGAYDALTRAALAKRLTADAATVLHDVHVDVGYSVDVNPPASASGKGPSAAENAAFERFARLVGYGLVRVANLPGNVGYIDLRYFVGDAAHAATVFDGAANSVAYAGAVILDLRDNHGGDPKVVARLLSHFLPPKTHLNDFVARGDGKPAVVDSSFTARVPGPRIAAPLYVLISRHTFSGGEECAYDVQALRRGTLVGAVTGGGANPGDSHRIDDHFSVFVPNMRARNPITKTNWEGVGVKPDVAVAPSRALETVYAEILDDRLRDPTLLTIQRDRLRGVRSKLHGMTDREILGL
jgi:retinol-binding protein 3